MKHASDSAEQRALEYEILVALAKELSVMFMHDVPPELAGMKLDGYACGERPTLVEVFAHVGRSKGGQRHKIAHDMTKLLLAERLLDVPCRKIIAVIDEAAVMHLRRPGWNREFVDRFEIDVLVVKGFEGAHAAMRAVQQRQRR